MPRYICYHEGLFFEWSTISDSPASAAMLPSEFNDYYKVEYGRKSWEEDFGPRASRAVQYGTSSIYPMSVREMIRGNRAGPDESELSLIEVINLAIDYRRDTGLMPLILNA